MNIAERLKFLSDAIARESAAKIVSQNAVANQTPFTFSKFQVEAMLNELSQLLDRVQRNWSEYEDLRARECLLALEMFVEGSEVKNLQDRCVKKNDPDDDNAEYTVEDLAAQNSRYMKDAEDAYNLNNIPFLGPPKNPADGDVGNGWWQIQWQLFQIRMWAGEGIFKDANWPQVGPQHLVEKSQGTVPQLQSGLQAARQAFIVKAAAKAVNLAAEDSNFRKKMIDCRATARAKKDFAVTDEDGALRYDKPIKILKNSIERDWGYINARLGPVCQGLDEIYDYAAGSGTVGKPAGSDFDSVQKFVRDALSWLVAFSQGDQTFTCGLSVRTLITPQQWSAAHKLASKTGMLKLQFQVADENFDDYAYLRIRGVSGSLVLSQGDGVFSAVLTAPQKSLTKRSTTKKNADIDQSELPPCRIGRMSSFASSRPPEIVGGISWYNVSPLSRANSLWTITVKPIGSSNPGLKEIRDVIVELLVAARPNSKTIDPRIGTKSFSSGKKAKK